RREGLLRYAPDSLPEFSGLTVDSRSLAPGSLFVAIRGTRSDGHRYIPDAVGGGAAAVVVESRIEAAVPQIVVRDGRLAAIALAREWFDDPAAALQLVATTGTNGKTTTTGLIGHLLNAAGDSGTIGTLGAFDGKGESVPSAAGSLTTPGPVDLHATFA